MAKYYAVEDLQVGCLMASGRNCTSKKQVLEDLQSYISVDFDNDSYKKYTLEDICDIWQFNLISSNKKYPDWSY